MLEGKLGMKKYFFDNYFLRDNPFSITPTSKEIFWSDRKGINENLERIIETSVATSPSRIIVNWGDWGTGKTHAMFYFTSDVFKKQFREKYGKAVDFLSVGVKLPRPVTSGTMGQSLYYEIINAIGIETIRRALMRISEHLNQEGYGGLKLRAEIEDYLKQMTSRKEYSTMFIRLLGKARLLERKFLYGESLTSSELGRLNIPRGINSINDMLEVIGLVTNLLTQPFQELGEKYSEIFVWIDENEAIRELTAKDVFIYRSFIRDLVDYASTDLTIFLNFSLSPGEDLSTVEASLGSAVNSRVDNHIFFPPIKTFDECVEYVEGLLHHFRTIEPEDPLHPFEREAFESIIKSRIERGWLPRELNKVMAKILEMGFADKRKKIDKKFVNENKKVFLLKSAEGQSIL